MAIQTLLAGGAIWGGTELIKALNIIPAIIGQFTSLGAVIEGTAAISSASLPIILGAMLAFKAFSVFGKEVNNLLDILNNTGDSFEKISSQIEVTDAKIKNAEDELASYENRLGNLTAAEQDYVDTLKQQIEALKQRKQELTDDSYSAFQQEAINKLYATRIVDWYDETTKQTYQVVEQYEVATEAVNGFIEAVKSNQRNTEAYKNSLQDFISTWGETVTKLKEVKAAGKEIDPSLEYLIGLYEIVNNELNDINKTSTENSDITQTLIDNNNKFADSYKSIRDGVDSANASLEKYKQATSYDYGAALTGYQSIFQQLKEGFGTEKLNIDQIRAGVELFFDEDKKSDLNYDLEAYAEELGKLFSGNLNKVLGATDPIQGLVNAIMQSGGKIVAESGEIAASIDRDNNLTIKSYSALADWLGTTEEVARALMGQIQGMSGQFVFAEEDIANLASELSELSATGESFDLSAQEIVAAIQKITGSTNPEEIRAYIDALREIGAVDPEVVVDADVNNAISKVKEVTETTDEIEDKTVTIKALADSNQVLSLKSAINSLNNKTVQIVVRAIDAKTGQLIPYSSVSNTGTNTGVTAAAKGTDGAKGGATLVNDGSPVNGSSAEAIVSDGRMYIAGQGEETIVNLNRGDKVLNAADTQSLLKKSGLKEEELYGGIPAFGSGTTHFPVGGYIGVKPPDNYDPTASGTVDITSKDPKKMKEEFDKWLKEKKHYLEMDMITEEEYYRDLEIMNEKYLAGKEEFLDEYWQHQEEIYRYQKQDLQDIIELEEKLNNLAKAKTQKVLVYKDGMFQYIHNTEAIARAQRNVEGYANGTTNAAGGLSLVGENGPELRVLGQGDGIIPSDITKNLMKIGSTAISAFGKTVGDMFNFNINTVKLEKINNVDEIFNGLKNLAIQKTAAKV